MVILGRHQPDTRFFSDDVICAVIPRVNPMHGFLNVQFQDDNRTSPNKPQACLKNSTGTKSRELSAIQKRERRRLNQARYRNKQKALTLSLQDDISKLQKVVGQFKLQRDSVYHGIPAKQTVWLVVSKYFRIFQFGFKPPTPELRTPVLSFLQNVMALDVTDGSICGPKAIMENWELLSIVFDDIHVQLERLESVGEDSLVATTTTRFTLKPDTLRRVFPLVDCGAGGGDREYLVKKLQDQRIVMHGSVRFDWDKTNDCIWRMNSQSDMLTPILHLLENLEDVSRVFDNALVTPDFRLVL